MMRLREKKLRRLLRFAYKRSPYYRETFAARGITEENLSSVPLEHFPTIDKDTLIAHFERIVTRGGVSQHLLRECDAGTTLPGVHFVHSSGTTGTPRYFYYDTDAWNTMLAGIIRGAFWGMGFWKMVSVVARGARLCYIAAVNGNYGGAVSIQDGIVGLNAEKLFIDLNTPVSQWLPKIKEFSPSMLMGYPSALKILAEQVEALGVDGGGFDKNRIQQIVTCGEPLLPSCRAYLEKVFARHVINFYGTSESLALGLEDSPEDGMILFDDLNYIEEIDGKMYVTCLYNYAQPLIRYHVSDRIRLLPDVPPKKDMVPFSRCSVVQSREEDIMWFTDGTRREFLHPLSVEGFCIEGLLDYQFVQKSDASFLVVLEIGRGKTRTEAEEIGRKISMEIQSILDEKNLDFVDFSISFTDKIAPSSNGKKKLVVLDM